MTRDWRTAAVLAALVASATAGHLAYPLLLAGAARLRARNRMLDLHRPFSGAVTVVVPAHREAGVIAQKIANLEQLRYAAPVRILVVTDGCAETAAAARAAGADVLELPRRRGKAQALNEAMEAVDTEVVVLSDANNSLHPDAVAALVEPFGDASVGATTGEKHEGVGGELAYWRFSSRLKRAESALGSTLGVDGALAAVRRSAWRPIPADISNDDYWIALDLMERGFRVVYTPRAVVHEDAIGGLGRSWQRRTRVLGGSLYVAWRKRHLLLPGAGLVAFELWGHKVWRSTAGPLSHGVLVLVALRSARSSWIARAVVAGHLYAALALVVPRLPLQAAGQMLYLQVVAVGGMVRVVRGDRMIAWDKPSR